MIKTINTIISVLDSKKAENIRVYYPAEQSSIADYIVIATSLSPIHLKTTMDAVYDELKTENIRPAFPLDNDIESGWTLMDYGNVIVHLFLKEKREYYDIDAIWAKFEIKDFSG